MAAGRKKLSEKKNTLSFLIITAAFLVLLCVLPNYNLISWFSACSKAKSQERLIRHYQKEIIEMDKRIHDLTNDKDSLEKFAREEFHFAEKGDDVYLLP